VEGSNSYDSTTGQGDWTKIFDSGVNSNALSSDRSAKNEFPVENDDTYRHYSLTIEKKEGSSKIHIGHFGLVQSYLMKYTSELYEDITGHNVLEPIAHAPSDSPTTVVTWIKGEIGATCDDTCDPLGLSCDSEKQTEIDTFEKVVNAFKKAGYTCKDDGDKPDQKRSFPGSPFSFGQIAFDCFYFGQHVLDSDGTGTGSQSKSSCSSNKWPDIAPLCACV